MRKCLFILSLVFIGCKSTRLKQISFIPTEGDIVFTKQSKIYDSLLFNNANKTFAKKFVAALQQQIIKERQELNKPYDSSSLVLQMSLFNKMAGSFLKAEYNTAKEKVYYHKYKDSLIISYEKLDGKILGDYRVINKNTNTFFMLAKSDSITKYLINKPYNYRDEVEFNITEFRDDTKTIEGFKCFKILVSAAEIIDDDLPKGKLELKHNYAMYVTEDISSLYHPVVWYKSVLEKYYPLEIIEQAIDGAQTKFSLLKMSLK